MSLYFHWNPSKWPSTFCIKFGPSQKDLFSMAQIPSKETRKSFSLRWFWAEILPFPKSQLFHRSLYLAGNKIPPWRFCVSHVFGMVKTWPEIRGCWWPPTRKIKRSRLESPGIVVFRCFCFLLEKKTIHPSIFRRSDRTSNPRKKCLSSSLRMSSTWGHDRSWTL